MHTLTTRDNTSSAVESLKKQIIERDKQNIIIDFAKVISKDDLHELGKFGITNVKNISACPLKLYYMSHLRGFLDLTLPLLCRKATTQKKINDRIINNAIKISKNSPTAKEYEIIRRLIDTLCERSALLNKLFKQNKHQAINTVVRIDKDQRNDFYYLQILLKLHAENINSQQDIYIFDKEGAFQKNAALAAMLSNITSLNAKTTSNIHYITCTEHLNSIIKPRFYTNLKKPN